MTDELRLKVREFLTLARHQSRNGSGRDDEEPEDGREESRQKVVDDACGTKVHLGEPLRDD